MFETSSGNAELIKELAASARYPVGDSALAALYQAGTQNSEPRTPGPQGTRAPRTARLSLLARCPTGSRQAGLARQMLFPSIHRELIFSAPEATAAASK
jgi:hypothetical protein